MGPGGDALSPGSAVMQPHSKGPEGVLALLSHCQASDPELMERPQRVGRRRLLEKTGVERKSGGQSISSPSAS